MLFPFKVENGKCHGTMELEKNEYLIYMILVMQFPSWLLDHEGIKVAISSY